MSHPTTTILTAALLKDRDRFRPTFAMPGCSITRTAGSISPITAPTTRERRDGSLETRSANLAARGIIMPRVGGGRRKDQEDLPRESISTAMSETTPSSIGIPGDWVIPLTQKRRPP